MIADLIPDLPDDYVVPIREKIAGLGDRELWWPVPGLVTNIELEFVNPYTDEVVFRSGPQETYWLTRWMDLPSYRKYVDDQPGTWPFDKKVPTLAWDYTLRYKINGRTFPDWVGHR